MNIQPQTTQKLRDALNITGFVVAVIVGAWLINLFVFRSFNVSGPSMENTLHTGERLIVNRLSLTWDHIRGRQYVPDRGDIIVFKNPHFGPDMPDEYIVKRVIAFPGEFVETVNGKLVVYKNEQRENPIAVDDLYDGPQGSTSASVSTVVPDGQIFVAGDHRQGGYSYDSRNGLGTIPYADIIGPVIFRLFPFDKMRVF